LSVYFSLLPRGMMWLLGRRAPFPTHSSNYHAISERFAALQLLLRGAMQNINWSNRIPSWDDLRMAQKVAGGAPGKTC
jgi:hypothetical protein